MKRTGAVTPRVEIRPMAASAIPETAVWRISVASGT